MTWSGPFPIERLPTLTEVVELAQIQPQPVHAEPAFTSAPAVSSVDSPAHPAVKISSAQLNPVSITEEQVINRVLTDLQIQIDLMFESRLREVLAPLLERATEHLVRDARSELASTLQKAVALAVAKELERHRTGALDR